MAFRAIRINVVTRRRAYRSYDGNVEYVMFYVFASSDHIMVLGRVFGGTKGGVMVLHGDLFGEGVRRFVRRDADG